MRVNAEFDCSVHIDSETLPWTPSPLSGVDRRMLDRIGNEVARATSIVRYAPESFFSPHHHAGGEEFLVLEGVFSDEHGDFGPLTYVRNPVGSRHKPFSTKGCVIFVKLWQMDVKDQEYQCIDTRNGLWLPDMHDGVEVQALHQYGTEIVQLERWSEKGIAAHNRSYAGGAEYLVLDGVIIMDGKTHNKGSWLRFPPGYSHEVKSETGTLFYLKTGHLPPRLDHLPV